MEKITVQISTLYKYFYYRGSRILGRNVGVFYLVTKYLKDVLQSKFNMITSFYYQGHYGRMACGKK